MIEDMEATNSIIEVDPTEMDIIIIEMMVIEVEETKEEIIIMVEEEDLTEMMEGGKGRPRRQSKRERKEGGK